MGARGASWGIRVIQKIKKYFPEQFDIIGMTEANGTGHSNGLWKGGNKKATIHGKEIYARIFIKAK